MHFSQKQLQNNQHLCHWQCQAQQQHWNSGGFVLHDYLSLSWSFFASFAPHCKIEEGFCIVIAMTELKLFAAWMTQRWKGVRLTQVHLVRGSQPAKLELHPPPLSPLHLTLTPISVVGTKGQDAGAHGPVVTAGPWGVLISQLKTNPRYFLIHDCDSIVNMIDKHWCWLDINHQSDVNKIKIRILLIWPWPSLMAGWYIDSPQSDQLYRELPTSQSTLFL